VDTSHYSGHSFRIGAATPAVKLGVSDSLIEVLGRGKSSAFTRYILYGHHGSSWCRYHFCFWWWCHR